MASHLTQSSVLFCGSARVGKSTLINAICQEKLAKLTASLNSVTKEVHQYSYECSNGSATHNTIIWDTPGIESWNQGDVHNYVESLIQQTQPICMIYCASPGSFALLEHIQWLVSECCRQNIFCALVCTNMWDGSNRKEVLNGFCEVLSRLHPNIEPRKEDNIIYYDKVALVTMVNSQQYVDDDLGVTKPPSGVEELIFGIAQCLNQDLMFAWFRTVSSNISFWQKMSSKLSGRLDIPIQKLNYLYQNLPDLRSILFQTAMTTDTEKNSSKDAEAIDIPKQDLGKKLVFTFLPQDDIATIKLSQALSKIGTKSSRTECSEPLTVIAEFDDLNQMEAIHDLWRLAVNNSQASCNISPV